VPDPLTVVVCSPVLRDGLWAGGPVRLETLECPRSVEVRLFHNADQQLYQLILVNLTTNPLVNVGYGPGVVRYITPHKGLEFKLKCDAKVSEVSSQIGSSVSIQESEGGVTLTVDRLDLYDSILIKY